MLKPQREVALSHNAEVFDRLAGDGWAVIDGVVPDRSGAFQDEAIAALQALAGGLDVFQGQTIYVVCHLYGSEPGEALLARSGRCAEGAVAALTRPGGPRLVPFGAGPLLPRVGSDSRLELILPHRRSH